MTRLVTGADAPDISLPATDGSTFKMSDYKGKRVILTFFRFSSCPFCNIRINRIVKRWSEFPEDTVMVGVFDAKIGELTKRMKKHNAPFTIVADESFEHFEKNSVMKSFSRFMWCNAFTTDIHASIAEGLFPYDHVFVEIIAYPS